MDVRRHSGKIKQEILTGAQVQVGENQRLRLQTSIIFTVLCSRTIGSVVKDFLVDLFWDPL